MVGQLPNVFFFFFFYSIMILKTLTEIFGFWSLMMSFSILIQFSDNAMRKYGDRTFNTNECKRNTLVLGSSPTNIFVSKYSPFSSTLIYSLDKNFNNMSDMFFLRLKKKKKKKQSFFLLLR